MSIKDEKGIALVLVLVVVALLVSLVVDFMYNMQVDVTLAANQRDEIKALYAARSGVELARLMLQEDDPAYDARGRDWERWDSTASIFDGKLPQRVKIAIYFKDAQGEPFSLSTTALITMGGE